MKPCCERDHNNDGNCDVHPPLGKMHAQLDPRIRRVVGDYRVIAPDARNKGGTVYLNGKLVIERRAKNGLGEDIWFPVGELRRPSGTKTFDLAGRLMGTQEGEMDEAIYYLLGGVTT